MEYREFFSNYGIETERIFIKDSNCVITINMNSEETGSFCEMVDRLNVYADNAIKMEIESSNRSTFTFEQRWLDMLTEAISKGEHRFYKPMNQPYYDMKLGYSCNNNCIHCVIKPNILSIQATNPDDIVLDSGFGMWCRRDLTYDQVLEQFNSESFKMAKVVTLTGGEPTVRNDFIDILKWLYFNRPEMVINLQTNGRVLCDWEIIKSVRRYCRNIRFLIAVHSSDEAVHNKVVNNRRDEGNPYLETMEGIKNIQTLFPESYFLRIEIVISQVNYMTLSETIKDLHQNYNIVNFKFSYPDMQDYEPSIANKIAPAYESLGSVLKDLNNYCRENTNLNVLFEDIPACVLNNFLGPEIYMVDTASFRTPNSVLTINAIGSVNEQGYFPSERRIKLECCKECNRFNVCQGIWPETVEINEAFISGLKKDF